MLYFCLSNAGMSFRYNVVGDFFSNGNVGRSRHYRGKSSSVLVGYRGKSGKLYVDYLFGSIKFYFSVL